MTFTLFDDTGWTRREMLKFCLTAVSLYAMPAAVACGPKKPFRVAIHPWAGYQFIFLARQEGLLPEKEIALVETSILSESAQALSEGRVDAATITLDEVLRLMDQGLAIKVALIFDVSAGADALLAVPEIRTPSELKGQRIGVENGTLGIVMLNKSLEAAGLQRSDVIVVPLEENHFNAWNQGHMNAVITYEPYLTLLEKNNGLHRIFDSSKLGNLILDVLAVRTEAVNRYENSLNKLIAGHFQAFDLWRSNPLDTSYRLASLLGTPPDSVSQIFRGLNLPDLHYNRKYLSAPANDLTRSALELGEIMQREGMIEFLPNLDRMFVSDYLPRKKL
jgi:NitT/TauT family transport system substrate-binding protein